MIDLEKLYSEEEVKEITGRDIYLRQLIRENKIRGTFVDKFYPHVKGKDLVRYLQTFRWGRKVLKEQGIEELPPEYFKEDDIAVLEKEMKYLEGVRDERWRALQITVGKIHDIQKKIAELQKL